MKSQPPNDPVLTVLGSGTCVPSIERSASAALIQTGRSRILIDAGPGTMRRMLEADTKLDDVSYIFFSHFHPDHTAELVPFLFASKYPTSKSRLQPLALAAGKGFISFFQGLRQVYGSWIELDPSIMEIVELDATLSHRHTFQDFTVDYLPMNHREESLAYRFALGNDYSLVYSGDTDFCENLIDLAKDADLLICESAWPDQMKMDGHLTPSLAGTIATRAKVKKLMLTHFYPECDQFDLEKECRQTYTGPLILAKDLMKIVLSNDTAQTV